MIEFQLLGEIRLRAADGCDVDALLRQPKRLALLSYLASPTPGTWHRRDTLLGLFWPDLDTAHARTSLRNSLYVLRQALGDEVVRTRGDEDVSIDPAKVKTDVGEIWAALREGRTADALEQYGGELLPALFASGSDGFHRWLDTERARLKVELSRGALVRVDSLQREGKFAEALGTARRVLEIQPDDEILVRRVITLHDAIGDRAGALGVFEGYRGRLATDFDAEPAPETMAMAARLRASNGYQNGRTSASAPTGARQRKSRAAIEPEQHALAPIVSPAPAVGAVARFGKAGAVMLLAIAIGLVIARTMSRAPGGVSIGTSAPLTSEEGLQIEPAISPNGRLVAYAKGNATRMRVYVQKIAGGPSWALSDDSTSVEILPRWSPDNDELLFLARNSAFVSPVIGGKPRLIAAGAEGDGMVRSASWSPNGDSVAIVRHDSLMVQPVDGKSWRYIGRGDQLHSCVWSPDTRWIACVSGNWTAFTPGTLFGNRAPSSLSLFPAKGGAAIRLTDREKEYSSPAWSADGKTLWFLSNRDGVSGEVYTLAIGSNGHPSGAFTRMGLNAESISVGARRIAYSVPVRRENLWSVRIPTASPLGVAAAVQMTSGNQVVELVNVSRDGKWLVYDSNLRGNSDIYRMPISGGTPDRLTDDVREEFAGTLSPDNRELAWQMWVTGKRHLFVKSIDGGTPREIIPEPGDQGVPNWSQTGSSIVAWSHNKEQGAVFVVHRDARGDWKKPAWRLEDAQLPVWSPDGRSIAFVKFSGDIELIPADSGAQRTIYSPRTGTNDPLATFLAWRTDPDILWFLGHEPHGRGGIWELDLRTRRHRPLIRFDDLAGKLNGPAFSSDGHRFFFTLDERLSNVRWAELMNR
jgi:Tol biopolymer transport system component/DNA-binding SARP family transcriptional activator